jgi:hypothetical protein
MGVRMASRREAPMGSMEEFIHYANLITVKRRLADPSITEEHRRMLARLLALEEAKRFHEKDDGSVILIHLRPRPSSRQTGEKL